MTLRQTYQESGMSGGCLWLSIWFLRPCVRIGLYLLIGYLALVEVTNLSRVIAISGDPEAECAFKSHIPSDLVDVEWTWLPLGWKCSTGARVP